MKKMKVALVVIVLLLLSTACASNELKDKDIDNSVSKVEVEVEPGDWKSDLLYYSQGMSFPLPSIRERAINAFFDNSLSEGHELLAVAHMIDNRIILLSSNSDSDSSRYNEEHLYGWIYNDVSGSLIESKWDANNIINVSEIDKEFVLNNILFPYNEQNINEINNVTDYLDSELKNYSLSYLTAYNDYYVLRAFEEPKEAMYIGLHLYIDYQGNLLEVEKYQYDKNVNGSPKFIEYTELKTEIKERLTRNQALEILKPHVELVDGQDFGDGSIREIDGQEYYIFTVFSEYTVDDAYCVDVLSGNLYSCDEELTLTPLE